MNTNNTGVMAEKKKGRSPLIRILFDYIKMHRIAFIVSLVSIFFCVVGNIAAPIILSSVTNILNDNLGHFEENRDVILQEINLNIIILVVCYVISIIGNFTYSQVTAVAGQEYMNDLRRHLFSHMEDLPIRYFDRNDKGDIMSVYVNDVDTVRQLIIQSLNTIMICFITFLAVLVMMLLFSVYLTLIVLFGAVMMGIATFHIGGHSSRNFIAQQKMIGKQEGFVEEMMVGLKVIKSFCHEEESKRDFDAINAALQDVGTRANSYGNILMPILGNIGNILYVVVALVGAVLFVKGIDNLAGLPMNAQMNIGIIVAFLPMVKQFTNTTAEIANQVNSIAMAVGGTARVCAMLDEKKEVDDGYVTLVRAKYDENGMIVECPKEESTIWAWKHPHSASHDVSYTLLRGDIRMFDVDFAYNPDKIVLHNISLYAKPGQKVAFVGATGAGKTTITNLLNRFYDIADGKIRYDGININKISKKDLRRSLGMVLQDTNLFSGTIMENIRYGKLDATDEECIAAAKLANADSFISRLPKGYETYITNDGGNLSQGQRQLLSIARAAVNNAPVLILDEATSSIDTRTEKIVTQGMDNLMKGRTVFVIAHRLSTIQNSDVIMVLDHGRIIERGTHEDLIALKGTYYQLYTGAFELE